MSRITRRRSSSRRKFRGRKATSDGETPHATLNLDDNIVRYHTYTYTHIHTNSQYYIACKYDIFTLGYLRACTWRDNSRVRYRESSSLYVSAIARRIITLRLILPDQYLGLSGLETKIPTKSGGNTLRRGKSRLFRCIEMFKWSERTLPITANCAKILLLLLAKSHVESLNRDC